VEEIRAQLGRGNVVFVARDEDPRDYRVSFEKIASTLGYAVTTKVPQGIAEVARALEAGLFPEPFAERYRNTP
jgi:hypothetical protein